MHDTCLAAQLLTKNNVLLLGIFIEINWYLERLLLLGFFIGKINI